MTSTTTGTLALTPLPQPEPGLTPQEVIARAEAMIPVLRAQQAEADERGHFSDEVLDAFRDAGFYRMLQPKLFGGYEFDSETFFEVVYRIAAGHPGTAWCFCLSATHVAVVASYFDEQGQRELLGDGEYRSPHRAVPGGRLVPVEGGYRATGTWAFSSGIPVSTHFMADGFVFEEGSDEPSRVVTFVLPREQVTVLDDWGNGATLGMQASGSNTVRVEDQFVPARWTTEHDILFGTKIDFSEGTPGTRLHGNPRYLGLFDPTYHMSFAANMAGTARAAVERMAEIMPSTKQILGAEKMDKDPDAMRALGKGAALADASHAVMVECARRIDRLHGRWAEDGQPITASELITLHALARRSALLGCEAVQLLFQSAGARASLSKDPMQRYLRDSEMYLVHASSQPFVDGARGLAEFGAFHGMVG
jgi:3-hydroxy-9,10-secoandrosta-1,3,5(10)-triene-9,17-dione monooxygenase